MSEQLKYKLDNTAVHSIAIECLHVYSPFDYEGFMAVVETHLDSLELKARATFIAECLFTFLPTDYVSSLPIIVEVGRRIPSEPKAWADYRLWPLLDFIALYGLREVSLSLDALEKLTPKFTAEFAIRAFLHEDFEQTYQRMLNWSEHQNEHVRRLASEGMRPRLPWATQLRSLRTDPTPIWPILEQLKNDPSLYVRRSVANNLNDISKDHPHQVLRCCRQWYGKTAECDWIVRHGLRSLVKTGEPSVYPLLGYTENPMLVNCQLLLSASQISIGETLTLSFSSLSLEKQSLVIDYKVYFSGLGNTKRQKVFKWKIVRVAQNESINIEKRHSIKKISTRRYYPGKHTIECLINGVCVAKASFELVN